MSQSLSYNVHDILKFKIRRGKKFDLIKEYNLPFSFFEVEEVDDPDIVLNIGKFKLHNDNCFVIDHKYHVKENYFYCKDCGGMARWEVEICGFEEGKTIVNFRSNVLGPQLLLYPDLLPQSLIFMPLIEYKLSQKGYLTLHSAAVSKHNKAFLLAGRSGAFKTTFTMDFIRRADFNFLGDERVIVHNNEVLSFPLHMSFFKFRAKYLSTEHMNLLHKICLTMHMWKKSEYMNASIKIAKSSKLIALFFLMKTNRRAVTLKSLSLEESIRKLTANNSLEMITGYPMMMGVNNRVYYKYLLVYSFVFPNSPIATYWDDLGKKLREILEGIPIYEMKIPSRYNLRIFDWIHKTIERV